MSSNPHIYYASRYYDPPALDLLTFLFESPHCMAQEDTILHLDAADPSNQITKSQARVLTQRLAHAFRSIFGIGAAGPNTDVVVGFSTGQILLPTAFYGVIAAGGVWSAASHSYTAEELARQIKQGDAKLVITSPDVKGVAVKAAQMCGLPLEKVVVLESTPGGWSFKSVAGGSDLLASQERITWKRITDPKELHESLIVLLYSSGTTGPPKGVMLSHEMLVSGPYLTAQPTREYARIRALENAWNPPPLRTLAHLPAAHIAGVSGYFVSPFYSGGSVYWMRKYNWADFLKYNKLHKITAFFTVPAIWARIGKSKDVTDQFATLEGGHGGAAPMDREVQRGAMRRVGEGKVQVGGTYGMSELTGSVCTLFRGMADDSGSVGILHPNVRARLVDESYRDVEPGQPGELLLKTPQLTRGYYRNEKATKEAFYHGWFCTGDVLEQRSDGLFYVVDRRKELIKYKGLQVAPAELEGVILAHPRVEDVAVIGVPGEMDTEVPRAYVVAERGDVSVEEIQELVKAKLAPYKQLRGGVFFLDEIPRNAVGKILRRDLRELAKKDVRPRL